MSDTFRDGKLQSCCAWCTFILPAPSPAVVVRLYEEFVYKVKFSSRRRPSRLRRRLEENSTFASLLPPPEGRRSVTLWRLHKVEFSSRRRPSRLRRRIEENSITFCVPFLPPLPKALVVRLYEDSVYKVEFSSRRRLRGKRPSRLEEATRGEFHLPPPRWIT